MDLESFEENTESKILSLSAKISNIKSRPKFENNPIYKKLPNSPIQIGYTVSSKLSFMQNIPASSSGIQTISSLILPCKGVYLISFRIVMLSESSNVISNGNIYLANNIDDNTIIGSYILRNPVDLIEPLQIQFKEIFIADENLEINCYFLFSGTISEKINIFQDSPNSFSLIDNYVISATRIG